MENTKFNEAVFVGGLKRGYIRMAERSESPKFPIPASLTGIRGNLRKALREFADAGCKYYTIENRQFEKSTLYYFTVYRGYKEAEK